MSDKPLRGWVELCAIETALRAPTQHELAGQFGRQRSTIARWARDQRFIARVAELRSEHFAHLRQSVSAIAGDARTALHTALTVGSPEAVGFLALQFLDKLGMISPVDVDDAVGSPAREAIDAKIIQAAERFRHGA